MSCEVKTFGIIPDLQKVQEHFGFAQDESWLNAVYYSVSPLGEVIAFGHGSKLVIVGSDWTNHMLPSYTINWKGELENPNDIITSIVCIPVYGSNVNSGADWTCIAIGLASGLVIFYADSGIEIFSQKWHTEQVQSIKAQSGKRVNEEIHIAYLSCICVLQGDQLFPILKGLKQNFSKSFTVSGIKTNLSQFPDTVPCRKWEYRNRTAVINDSVIVGSQRYSAFDYLLEQSLTNGFYTKLRSSPPQTSLVLGVGVKPYVGFYYAKEGFNHVDLGDVAKAVANKVMSSLPNWLYKSSQASQEDGHPMPVGEPMQCRFGICDIQRQAFNVWVAPGNELAVISDNLSRIILIDCNRGTALRIWKGYRDAQCSFIKVTEKLSKSERAERRKCMFLVIFAPRRSCLEIWALQNGPKVAAFTVCKNGQLIYNTHSLMGVSPGARVKYTSNTCLFFDPSDQSLKEILVPFHCALSDANSITAKDIHLLRRMKMILRGDSTIPDTILEIETVCSNFQTNEIKIKCLEMLAKNKKVRPDIFKKVISIMETQLEIEKAELNTQDYEHLKILRLLITNYRYLVDFYIGLSDSNEEQHNSLNDRKLCLIENDLETIQKLLDLMHDQEKSSHSSNRVTFDKNELHIDFNDYLNIFDIDKSILRLNTMKLENWGLIGKNIFSQFLEKDHDLQIFNNHAQQSTISSGDFMMLLLYYWLEKPFSYLKCEELIEDMTRLASIIENICDLAGEELDCEYNDICPWWQDIREILLESTCALRSLLAAIVCRNISIKRRKQQGTDEENSISEEDCWEEVSQEAAQWSLLIGKLDDISVLGAILSSPISSSKSDMPKLSYDKPDCSLKAILYGGKGIISELVGKWLTSSGVHPKYIIKQEANDVDTLETKELVIKYLELLREHFPFSLHSGVLLCHMVWEYMCHWSKNLSSLIYLKAGLDCLNTFQYDDYAIKHGLCCMIWNAHLKIPLEATKKLIQKTGRLPKEKLCQQDIGISDNLVSELLENCLIFLEHFSSSLNHEKIDLKFEETLQEGQIPLSCLTLQQNIAVIEIINLHVELCKVLHLITSLSLKIPKPITHLFDAMSNQTFFIEINRTLSYTLPKPDLILQKQRQEFLYKAISAAVDLIREDTEELYITEHVFYMEKIYELTEMWEIEKTLIKKRQVVELYAHGWDSYAEEKFERIVDKADIGSILLEIAGKRLNLFIGNSGKFWSQVAAVGNFVTDYLDTVKLQKNGTIQISQEASEIELDALIKLTGKAFQCLSTKDSRELRIAGQMFDACSYLKEYIET